MAESDRVRVPTNGHRPSLDATDEAARPGDDVPPSTDLRIAFTPAQLAAGFGILAGLLLLLASRRRGGRGDATDDADAD